MITSVIGNLGQNTLVRSIPSPDGAYYAEVIDCDQGALGGNTLVDVYENSTIDACLFEITPKPQCIYRGDWGEFVHMDIYGKNDLCLVINAVEYELE